MKKILVLLSFLLVTLAYSQENRYEKIRAMKTAYITEQLELSSAEAEKFWPIYNKYRQAEWKIRGEEYKILQEYYRKPLNEISEAKAKELLNLKKRRDIEEQKLLDTYLLDLQFVLPANKVFMLHKVEDDFKRRLLHWLSETK